MFQFTTTTIINSNLDSTLKDSAGNTIYKYAGTATDFTVTRVNKFKKANIVSIYKRPYEAPVLEVATIVIGSGTFTTGLVTRLEVILKLSGSTESDYASTYMEFKKPVVVEVISATSAAVTAGLLVDQLNGLKNRFGQSYVTASNGGTSTITITCKEKYQRVKSAKVLQEVELTSTTLTASPSYADVSGTFTVTTAGKEGFGDYEYMIKNISLPTLDKNRWAATNQEEKININGQYTEYALRYSIDKDGNDGINANGKSITTHIFFVDNTVSNLLSSFEDALETTNPGIITIGGFTGVITISGDEQLDLSLAETTTLVAANFNYPNTISWSSGTTGVATINSSTGVVTAVGVGSTVITATESSTGRTGTFTLRVVA